MADSADDFSSSNENRGDAASAKKRKRTKYAQKYSSDWESEKLFKSWLRRSKKGADFFYCTICDKDYSTRGGKADVKKHMEGIKHGAKGKAIKVQQPINERFGVQSKLNAQVKRTEIKLAAYCVEHNIAFNAIDHLPDLIRDICPDSVISRKMSCGRTKCTKIVQNVTGQYSFEELVKSLQGTKFSLIVDESTDVSSVKHLALVARYTRSGQIVDQFLGLIKVSDTTSNNLYAVIKQFFTDHQIPYQTNMIGFAADTTNNMFGVHHSLSTLLKKDIPDLFLMKYICHSFALCASYSCEKLPRVVEDVARDVYNYLSHSYKRKSLLQEFQRFVEVKPHKILQPCQTRWLSLHQVVKRLLEQYEALILYFTDAVLVDKVLAAEMILSRLRQPYVKMYLQFLDYILPYFNDLNKLMQSEETSIHLLYDRVLSVYKSFLSSFIKNDYLKKIEIAEVDFEDPGNYMPIEDVYFGATLSVKISEGKHGLSSTELLDFRQRCMQFYIEGCTQIHKRFNFQDKAVRIIKKLSMLHPRNVIEGNEPSIAKLASYFPNLISVSGLNDLDREWREVKNSEFNFPTEVRESKKIVQYLKISEFWIQVSEIECGDGEKKFPTITSFVSSLLCLPHSSACVERIFSQININKTKLRNRLDTDFMSGILHTKSLMKNVKCFEIPITASLLHKHKDSMYDRSNNA